MTILRKNYDPGFPAYDIPGTPAIPPQPAYCQDTVVYSGAGSGANPGGTGGEGGWFVVPDGPYNGVDPRTGQPYEPGTIIYLPGFPGTGGGGGGGGGGAVPAAPIPAGSGAAGTGHYTVVTQCYPAVAGVPAGPPEHVAGREANFNPGWNAAADSIQSITTSGQYRFKLDPDAVGIVTGLTPNPLGSGYSNITHGVYCTNGQFQYMENGVALNALAPFSTADEWIIARGLDGRVTYFKNGALAWSSLLLSSGVVWADAAEYFGGDEIDDAHIEAYAPPVPWGPPGPPSGIGSIGPPTGPGYTPGTGPVPPPGPGEFIWWMGANGTLGHFHCVASDSSMPNGVPPSDPPDPTQPVDPNGDWPERMGGTLRNFVGRCEGAGYGPWNGGSVGEPGNGTTPGTGTPGDGTVPGPGQGGPVDPLTGDWFGRSGGQWTQFVGSGFGGSGAGANYATCSGRITGFVGDGGGGQEGAGGGETLQPQYAILVGVLQPFAGFMTTLQSVVGTCRAFIGSIDGFAANVDGGFVGVDGPPPFVPPTSTGTPTDGYEPDYNGDWPGRIGGQWRNFVCMAFEMSAVLTGGYFENTHGGEYQLIGQGNTPAVGNDPVTGLPVGWGFFGLHGGGWTLDAWGGGIFEETGPAGSLVATGTAAILGTFDEIGPVGDLVIQGTVGIGGGFLGEHFGGWTLQAYGGGYFNEIGPAGTLGSSTGGTGGAIGNAGAAGSFLAIGPGGTLVASGVARGEFGVFDEVGPALQALWGDLFAIGPSGILVAAGNPLPGLAAPDDSEGYSITLLEDAEGTTSTASSRYTQYPFERIVRFGSAYLGITPSGIFQLGGETFDGVPIVAQVAHPPHDFPGAMGRAAVSERAQLLKTMRSIFLTGHIPATVEVSVAVDDDPATLNPYTYTPEATDTARNHRIDVGRGLEGRYIQMSLTNPDGKDFVLEETSAEFDVSKQRKIWRT